VHCTAISSSVKRTYFKNGVLCENKFPALHILSPDWLERKLVSERPIAAFGPRETERKAMADYQSGNAILYRLAELEICYPHLRKLPAALWAGTTNLQFCKLCPGWVVTSQQAPPISDVDVTTANKPLVQTLKLQQLPRIRINGQSDRFGMNPTTHLNDRSTHRKPEFVLAFVLKYMGQPIRHEP
jgi:hypothetical protein